jgi:thiamine-monophosphate kinase
MTEKRTEIADLGEFGLIKRITQDFELKNTSSIKGIGDDAAVILNNAETTVISTDLLVEGIHFDLMYTPLKHLGYKSIVVNVSDIYAMNAIPTHVTVSIAMSNKYSVEAIEELYQGIKLACDRYEVDLIGGDTTSSPKGMTISITAFGQASQSDLVYRNGARVGDLICVTGDFGAAYLGLQILEREKQLFLSDKDIKPDLEEQAYLIERQLKPEARKDMIDAFRAQGLIPTSMIDVSDGLASELYHICTQSNVGAFVEETGVPIHPQAQLMALKFKLDPITCALSGGEDYELLFTISPDDIDKVKYLPDIYIMGEITKAEDGIKLHTKGGNIHPITAQGWDHFN